MIRFIDAVKEIPDFVRDYVGSFLGIGWYINVRRINLKSKENIFIAL